METRGSSDQPPISSIPHFQANNSVAVQVRKILVRLYQADLVKFIEERILKKHNALIAGGSILSCILGRSSTPLYRINDLDIYVSAIDAFGLYKKLQASPLFEEIGYSTFVAPEYDASFFKKNHIVFRTSFHCNIEFIPLRLDVIVVDKDHSITKVVSNFDLKCCEVWYMFDKTSKTFQVYCSSEINMNYLLKKQTFLSNDYFKSYINGNVYIKTRLEKYHHRNFKIYFGDINTTQIDDAKLTSVLKIELSPYEYYVEKKKNMDPAANEMWLIKKFFQDMVISCRSHSITPIILLFFSNQNKTTNPFIIFDEAITLYSGLIGKKSLELKLEIWTMCYNLAKSLNDVIHDPSPEFYKIALEKYLAFYLGIPSDIRGSVNDVDKTLENIEFDKTALLQSNVWDFIMFDDIPFSKINQLENIIIVIFPNIYIGLPITYLTYLMDNQKDNWFYECDGEVIASTGDKPPKAKGPPYCAVPVDKDGLKGLILLSHLKAMLSGQHGNIFIIEQDDSFSHTISHKNKIPYTANWVSSNHCQAGSTYIKFKVFKTINVVSEDIAKIQYNDHLNAVYGRPEIQNAVNAVNAQRDPMPPTSRTTTTRSIPRPSSPFLRPSSGSSTATSPARTTTNVSARSTTPSIITNISRSQQSRTTSSPPPSSSQIVNSSARPASPARPPASSQPTFR